MSTLKFEFTVVVRRFLKSNIGIWGTEDQACAKASKNIGKSLFWKVKFKIRHANNPYNFAKYANYLHIILYHIAKCFQIQFKFHANIDYLHTNVKFWTNAPISQFKKILWHFAHACQILNKSGIVMMKVCLVVTCLLFRWV